jgi:hypothetical protein
MGFELPIEAEEFKIIKGWKVIGGGYFASQPNLWSLNLIMADEKDTLAIAEKEIEIPEDGNYNLWVRYESCYGFNSIFRIKILQDKKIVSEKSFGHKDDKKYFPFGKGYTVQKAWEWHNTDFVYQGMNANIRKGKAKIIIIKDKNEKPAAKRIIDFIYITDDLSIVPGNDWNWRGKNEPPIISRFKKPLYLKISSIDGSSAVQITTSMYLIGYYKGPKETYYAIKDKLIEKPKKGEMLNSGETTGWQKIMVSSVMPPEINFTKKGDGKVIAEIAVGKIENVVKKIELKGSEESFSVIVGIGKKRYEEGLLGKYKVLTLEEILKKQKDILENYKIKGNPAKKLLIEVALRRNLNEQFELALSFGANSAAYWCPPEIYGINPILKGFNTDRGALTVQNWHMTKECYSGDFSKLEERYKKFAEDMEKTLGRKIPYSIKLIEETGPPEFETLMTYLGLKQQYIDYLNSEGLTIEDVEKDPDISFYHKNRFRALIYARLNATATKLIEKYFPEGTKTNSGSIYPSTGSIATLERGDDPFLLFKERGVTEFSSEISWGWGGMPDYISPQTQSYEAALARSLCKYHNCPMGSYLISDGNRGYTGDYVELASYPMYTQDFKWLHFYDFGLPSECSFIGSPDVMKGIKRVSYTIGMIEDDLINSKLVPAKIAIGWSSSTDIWDLSIKPDDPNLCGNCVYPQERQNLYLLLRHIQYPVDILSEEDLIDGYLKNYDVFILIADHLRPEAAEALKKWVGEGKILISVAGGGLLNHYNKPLETLKEVFGIKSAIMRKEAIALRPKLELLHSKPLDTVIFENINGKRISFEIFGYRQNFDVKEGKVIARYKNGEIACVENNYGNGKAIIMGFLPGASYVRPAIPLKPYGRGGIDELSNFIPVDFSKEVAGIFKYFLSDIKSPVLCSENLVEAILRKKENGYIIPLINYSGRDIKNLKVRLSMDDIYGINSVESVFSKCKFRKTTGSIEIIIDKISKFDCLKVERK